MVGAERKRVRVVALKRIQGVGARMAEWAARMAAQAAERIRVSPKHIPGLVAAWGRASDAPPPGRRCLALGC